MTTIERIANYLAQYGPANSGDIGRAISVPASTVFSIVYRNEDLFHSRPGRNQNGNTCLVWDVFRSPDSPPPVGTLVSWMHNRPGVPPLALCGEVVGADWDGVHIRSHGSTFAVPLREVRL